MIQPKQESDANLHEEWVDESPEAAAAFWAQVQAALSSDSQAFTEGQTHSGLMVAFELPQDVAQAIADAMGDVDLPNEAERTPQAELHITLTYTPSKSWQFYTDDPAEMTEFITELLGQYFMQEAAPLEARLAGVGRFAASETSDGKDVLIAQLSIPGLDSFREALVSVIEDEGGLEVSTIHKFVPHITLAYIPSDVLTPDVILPTDSFELSTLLIKVGDNDPGEVELQGSLMFSEDMGEFEFDEGDDEPQAGPSRLELDIAEALSILRFDITNPQAISWIQQSAGDLVQQITQEQRQIIQKSLQNSFEDGVSAIETASRLRSVIGLTTQQAGYIEGYRKQLEKQGVKPDVIDRLTNKYRERWVRFRAENIARTETIRASNVGQDMAWQQGVQQGFILPTEMERIWIVTPDDRLCPSCRLMQGKRAPIGGAFEGGFSGPPRHVRCRCTQELVQVGMKRKAPPVPPPYDPGPPHTLKPAVPKSALPRGPIKASEILAQYIDIEDAKQFFNHLHDTKGKFAKTSGAGRAATHKADRPVIAAAAARVFEGQPVPLARRLSKQQAGALGERIVLAYLRSKGFADARPLNTKAANFPVDMVQDHAAIEVKTGLVSNSKAAQKWRATIGEPSKATKAWLLTATAAEKRAFNQHKNELILERKKKAVAELSRELGHRVKGQTITTILNPDTRTVDLYHFQGFHLVIPWNSPEARRAFVGSYSY